MRPPQLFAVAVTLLCSAVVVLVQPSPSEAVHVYEALFARAFFFGKDTSDPSATNLDIFQQPKNHPTAIASILLNAAFAASFEPKDGVITDPEAFSEFEARVSRISALQLGQIQKKTVSLTGDYHQLACEISKKYDSQHADTVATAFRGLIPRFVAENPWRNLLLVVMLIDRDDATEHITVEMVSITVTITKNFGGRSIISRQQAALTQKTFHVDATDLVYNAEKWEKSVYIHDVGHFLERMSSAKNPDRPDDDDRPSTCDGIFKGIQDFFSGIDGIFESIRDFLVGIIRLSTSIPESIAKFFSKIFKSIGGLFTFLRDLVSKGFHAFMDFFSETVMPLLICAWRLLPYIFGWSLVGGLALPLIISGVISALGFTPEGITEGSSAASFMSCCHPIAMGSLFAIFQSWGTKGCYAGFSSITVVIGVAGGGIYGVYLGYFVNAVCSA
ncbi:hypothetical protein BGZ51_004877 [Haplosporangium sp. Z 767]|nr:hypothetical protein BGZ51_004877 [Haplosporangium sp. Z 767]KAF9182471.1 hypothetical protein BGZ50_004900 [Haplosporangium sp. Z 11]